MPRRAARIVFRSVAIVLLFGVGAVSARRAPAAEPAVRNVIVLIVDGCSSEQYTLARWCKGAPLALDAIRVGAVKTCIADSVIADSAPAASAYATGYRTGGQSISWGPEKTTVCRAATPGPELGRRPLATVLEGARLQGKATGIVATSSVTHATPAAFMAHAPSRGDLDDIMEQAVYQNVDVILGGGTSSLLPKHAAGTRADGENLDHVLAQRDYQRPHTREALMRITSGKVFGTFADEHMAAEIDRPRIAGDEPSLKEMTLKAIELLSRDPDGFFLMVEASQVDWACHAMDPSQLVSDLLMYDRVVESVLDFARRDGRTLVLALSDHNTGGMIIGNRSTDRSYRQTAVEALVGPVMNMKCSAKALWAELGDEPGIDDVRGAVAQYWGLDITDDEAAEILRIAAPLSPSSKHSALGRVVCPNHTCIGWTTHGHAGGDVPLHAFGPGRPVGLIDAPQIGRIVAGALGLNMEELNRRLFREATAALPDARVTIDEPTPENFVVRIEHGGRTALLPANKNLLEVDGRTIELEGLVVCERDGPTSKAYVPREAVERIRAAVGRLQATRP